MAGYSDDLAYIHDMGFGGFAVEAAPALAALLRRHGVVAGGLVVDLGCGSGILARELTRAGYRVLGVDISESMIRLARKKAPRARFACASLMTAELPPCDAVTSIGECVNYCFDPGNTRQSMIRFFRRVHTALRPGGVFIFDFAEPGQDLLRVWRKPFRVGEDWAVLSDAAERRGVLIRRITSFRRIGRLFRRTEEIHTLRLYRASELVEWLQRAGFSARVMRRYGALRLPPAHAAIVARPLKRAPHER